MNEDKIRIKQYEQTADEKVSLDGIKWLRKWDVCVQCDSAEEAEALRARLAQPEPAECDGGQCGIGGYCKECPKPQQSWCKVMNGCDREWVGLTDEEAKKTFENHNCTISADLAGILARAIKKALKDKNK